jgi:hypothetical protein
MGLTNGQDVFVSISETGINTLFLYLQKQRSRLFNYGTPYFVANPKQCCVPLGKKQPLTHENPLPVPGTAGLVGLEYAVQFTKLHVDLHPQDAALPPELTLPPQRFSFSTVVHLSIPFPKIPPDWEPTGEGHRKPPVFELEPRFCCELKVFLVGGIENVADVEVGMTVDELEIVDVSPDCLETILERYSLLTLRHGILNKVKLQATKIALGFIEVGLSSAITPNPSIEDSQIKVWLMVSVP